MLLRREIHLILWVSALSLIGLALFRATLITSSISLGELDSVTTGTSVGAGVISDASSVEGNEWKRSFADVPLSSRTLFPSPAQTSTSAVDVVPDAHPAIEPALRGILSTEAGRKGVFVDPTTGGYLVVGIGERIAGYTVEAIDSDQLVAQSTDAEQVIFYLRGPGELP
jgi:hypothetical protein